jgi:hypothetical protein
MGSKGLGNKKKTYRNKPAKTGFGEVKHFNAYSISKKQSIKEKCRLMNKEQRKFKY